MGNQKSIKLQKYILLFSFLVIPTILMILFIVYPTLKLVQLSFTNWDGMNSSLSYIGVSNFKEIITKSPNVWLSLKNNGIYFIIHLLFIPVEIFIAYLLDDRVKVSKFFKTVVFLPYIVNGVAVAYMFSFLYSSEGGVLNTILMSLNLGKVQWLSNPKVVNYSLAGVSIWRYSGIHIILFLAGLQSLPKDMLEAAVVDGANSWQKFWKIIIPNVKTVLEIILFLNVRGALMVFDIPFVMTSGGPGQASSTFILNTINTAFKYSHFGKASAMAIILIGIIVIFSCIQKLIFGRKR